MIMISLKTRDVDVLVDASWGMLRICAAYSNMVVLSEYFAI